jgi:hypothetical protein
MYIKKEHDRDKRDVSENMLAQKRMKNVLTFDRHIFLERGLGK